MKLAWFCYCVDGTVEVLFEEPVRWNNYDRVVQVVYAEVE